MNRVKVNVNAHAAKSIADDVYHAHQETTKALDLFYKESEELQNALLRRMRPYIESYMDSELTDVQASTLAHTILDTLNDYNADIESALDDAVDTLKYAKDDAANLHAEIEQEAWYETMGIA